MCSMHEGVPPKKVDAPRGPPKKSRCTKGSSPKKSMHQGVPPKMIDALRGPPKKKSMHYVSASALKIQILTFWDEGLTGGLCALTLHSNPGFKVNALCVGQCIDSNC